jgi:hypothetical protein
MKRDEKVIRKSWVLALMAVLALSLCQPQMVMAQVTPPSNETHGTFGNRTLGQPLAPRPSKFGGGIQTGASGSFLYRGRPDGSTAFAAPWRRVDTAVLNQAVGARSAAQPALHVAVSPQSPAPEYNLPELLTIPEFASPSFPEATGQEGTSPPGHTLGMTRGIGSPAASNVTVPQVGTREASASAMRPQPYARSPELSDRLTRLARTNGMLSGQGIDVYLSNDIALLLGTVRTPGDCVLLANVLALEPAVRQIDNRLAAEGSGTLSSNRKSR